MADYLSEQERQWFYKKVGSGVDSQTPINDIKKIYFISEIGGASADVTHLGDLEKQWLRKRISDNGDTPVTTKYVSELWRQVVASEGLTPSARIEENKMTFYTGAT